MGSAFEARGSAGITMKDATAIDTDENAAKAIAGGRVSVHCS